MNAPHAYWLLPLLGILASLAILFTSLIRVPKRPSILGIVLTVLGLALSFYSLHREAPAHRTISLGHAPATQATVVTPGFVSMPPDAGDLNRGRLEKVDLSITGQDLPSFSKGTGKNHEWILLDASSGIRPEYLTWVQKSFGTTEEVFSENPICWRRTVPLPFASGLCEKRDTRFILGQASAEHAGSAPLWEDMAVTPEGKASIRVLRQGNAWLIFVGHRIPEAPSREEGCLLSIAQGRLCTGIEILPGAALSALSLKGDATYFKEVMNEFGLSTGEALERAYRFYGTETLTETLPVPNGPSPCGGALGESTLFVTELSSLSAGLGRVRSEGQLSQSLTSLDQGFQCPALQQLMIPSQGLKNKKSTYRSLLAQIEQRPFWLTNARSYATRIQKASRTKAVLDSQQVLWVKPDPELKQTALTVVSPIPFTDETLERLEVDSPHSGFQVHRLGPSAFRLSIDLAVQAPVGIALGRFVKATSEKQISFDKLAHLGGFAKSLLAGFIIAAMLALIHALALRGEGRSHAWSKTHLAVWSLSFILIWLSYQSALRPGQGEVSIVSNEWPADPTHVFLRDWPDEWFFYPDRPARPSAQNAPLLAATWLRYLREANAHAAVQSAANPMEKNLEPVTTAGFWRRSLPGTQPVLVWDAPEVKNFYFRRSPDYQSMLTAWQDLALETSKRGTLNLSVRHDPVAEDLLKDSHAIILIPDLAHLSRAHLDSLNEWVMAGGHLVFSDSLTVQKSQEQTTDTPLLRAASAIGFGHSSKKSYSQISIDGENALEVKVSHRTLEKDSWWKTARYGEGRISFMGVSPLDQESGRVSTEVLARIAGMRLEVRDAGTGCATTLLLEPFGAPPGHLQRMATDLKQQGIQLRWWLSPESFARMVPIWQNSFRQMGVVFLDDGKPETRFRAEYLWNKFRTHRPVELATLNEVGNGAEQGPKGMLFHALALRSTQELSRWRTSCVLGAADVRYLPAKTLFASKESETTWSEALLDDGPRTYTPPSHIARRAKVLTTARDSSEGEKTKTLDFSKDFPTRLIEPSKGVNQ